GALFGTRSVRRDAQGGADRRGVGMLAGAGASAIDGASAGEGEEPGQRSTAARVVPFRLPPDLQVDVARHLLGGAAVAEDAQCQPVHHRRGAVVERCERALFAVGGALDQHGQIGRGCPLLGDAMSRGHGLLLPRRHIRARAPDRICPTGSTGAAGFAKAPQSGRQACLVGVGEGAPTRTDARTLDGWRIPLMNHWTVCRSIAAAGLALAVGGTPARAASHREAPLMTLDPAADITDVYAFMSYDDADVAAPIGQRKVTLIMNVIPGQEPGSGPNYFAFDDN